MVSEPPGVSVIVLGTELDEPSSNLARDCFVFTFVWTLFFIYLRCIWSGVHNTLIDVFLRVNKSVLSLLSYLPTPLFGQDMTQGQFLSVLSLLSTVKHILIECTDLVHMRKTFNSANKKRELFQNTEINNVISFLKTVKLYTKIYRNLQ